MNAECDTRFRVTVLLLYMNVTFKCFLLCSALYKEPEGPIIFSALRPLKTEWYQQQIEELATQRHSGEWVYIVTFTLSLVPSLSPLLLLIIARSLPLSASCDIPFSQSDLDVYRFVESQILWSLFYFIFLWRLIHAMTVIARPFGQ